MSLLQNNDNTSIIDVRTKEEFESGHYPGAINIPLDEVMSRIGEIKKMGTSVIAYCRNGSRSASAVEILSRAGIPGAINGGGLEDMFKRYAISNHK